MNSRGIVTVVRWALAFVALAGIVLVYHRWVHVNPTTVALTLLLFILMLASKWGLRYAVVVSLASAVSYNYFFLPPVGTFVISDPQNWLAMFAFLATSILASRLSQRARDQADEARSRQRELEILFRLSREFLQSESATALMSSAPAAIASATGAAEGKLYWLDGDRLYQAGSGGASAGELEHFRNLASTLPGSVLEGDEVQVPLRTGVRPKGLLVLRGTGLTRETADAIGGLISISIDRAEALGSVARAEAAKESERLRSVMIDSITHELRTPLTSIKGAASTMLAGNVSPDDGYELLTIINEEADRLNRLVSEAVGMAQLDAQQVQMNLETVNVVDLLNRARADCLWVEEKHPLQVQVPDTLKVWADPAFLSKVLCNLLENAGKYSPDGSPVVVKAERKGDDIVLSVADQGAGIDANEQSLIFERFYRAPAQSGVAPGTGMGLAVSRAIVEAHGGHIAVVSQLGRGSVFTFTVPSA